MTEFIYEVLDRPTAIGCLRQPYFVQWFHCVAMGAVEYCCRTLRLPDHVVSLFLQYITEVLAVLPARRDVWTCHNIVI